MNVQTTFDTLRAELRQLTPKELRQLREDIDRQLQDNEALVDWFDVEYMEAAKKEVKEAISLSEARAILAKIQGNLSDTIIADRDNRF
ncbi:hypothetical protein IH992_13385 [Candidatus Poribacteria bacterium]|nr:hypothetical protein [Candidatus Poribacteria bacterium]